MESRLGLQAVVLGKHGPQVGRRTLERMLASAWVAGKGQRSELTASPIKHPSERLFAGSHDVKMYRIILRSVYSPFQSRA